MVHLLPDDAQAQPRGQRGIPLNPGGEIERRLILPESSSFLERFEPTSDGKEILRRQAYFKERLSKIGLGGLGGEWIGRVKPIKFRRDYLHDRILIVDENEVEKPRNSDCARFQRPPRRMPKVTPPSS